MRNKQINYIIFTAEADTDDAIFAIVIAGRRQPGPAGQGACSWLVFVLCPVSRDPWLGTIGPQENLSSLDEGENHDMWLKTDYESHKYT